MVYTYKNLRDQVLRLIDEADDTGTTLAIVKDLMNQAHQVRCAERQQAFMEWPKDVTITTIAGQREYALHQEYDRPKFFKDNATGVFLQEIPKRELDDANLAIPVNDLVSGEYDTLHFYYSGISPVATQPTSATTVRVVSTSGSDTGSNYQVVIKGELADGSIIAEVLTMNGASQVTSSAAFQQILGVTKNQDFNGTLTLSTSGGTTLVSLLPWEMGRQYQTITLIEDPGVRTITYRFYRMPLTLVNDYDIPDIRAPYSQVLVWDTLLLLAGGYLTDSRLEQLQMWQEMQRKWEFALHSSQLVGLTIGARQESVNTRRLEA